MTRLPSNLHVAIACGGTGGHLFPGLAVAGELERYGCDITLCISPREVDQNAVRGVVGMDVLTLPVVGLQGGNLPRFLLATAKSRRQARKHFAGKRPHAVLAMGGFTSAPPILAGRSLGAVTFLHESNTIPGRANRMLAHLVDECFVGFHETVARLWNPRVTWTGTPVRPCIEPQETSACRVGLGLNPDKPVLLIMGGSQGASGINELVLGALPALAAGMPDLQFLHLSGERDFNTVKAAHAAYGRRSVVRPFFSEMEFALGAATLAVCRSGASTLAELAAMRVPSILMPFPAATDDHQFHNAAAFSRTGAALLLNQKSTSPQVFARETLKLATNPVRREAMSASVGRWHSPDAAARIASRVVAFASLNHPEARVLNLDVSAADGAQMGLRPAVDPETNPTHETPRAEHGVARSR